MLGIFAKTVFTATRTAPRDTTHWRHDLPKSWSMLEPDGLRKRHSKGRHHD